MKRIQWNKNATIYLKLTVVLAIIAGPLHPLQAQQLNSMTYEQTRIISSGYELPEFSIETNDTLLNKYLEIAYQQSDKLRAAFYGWVAVKSRSEQAGYLPEPEVMFNYFVNPMRYDGPFAQASIGVVQMFPWFGTRKLEKDGANLLSHASWQQVELARLDVYEQTKLSWYTLVLIYRHKAHYDEHLEWIRRLERLTRSRVESGYASRADMLQLEIERTEVQSMLDALEVSFKGQLAKMNALLNRPAQTEITLPAGRPELNWEQSFAQTTRLASSRNPSIIELEVLTQASESRVELSKLQRYPMIGVGAEVMGSNSSMSMDGSRIPLYATITVRLPVWRSRYQAMVREAEAEERMYASEKDALTREIQAEVSMLLADYEEAEIRVGRYRDTLLPRSRELTDLLLLDYSNGRIRMDEVIQARRRSVEYATFLEDALFDRNRVVVALERLTAGGTFKTQEL
jgi:outer membrane protein, heavy metal efflux system